ncbi:MAG: hypothetical protein ACJAQ5_000994, partial [Flavobacteriales bacterium]
RDLLSRRYYSLSHRQFSLSHRRHSFSQAPHLVSHKRRLLPTNGIRGYCRPLHDCRLPRPCHLTTNGIRGYCRQPRRWLLFGNVFKIENRRRTSPLMVQHVATNSIRGHRRRESHGRMSIRPQGRPFTFYFLPSVTLHSAHSPYNCLLRATFSNYGCH